MLMATVASVLKVGEFDTVHWLKESVFRTLLVTFLLSLTIHHVFNLLL